MSKLIRDDEPSAENSSAPVLLPLSKSVVVNHLKSCQELCRDHVERAFDIYLRTYNDALDLEIDRAVSNADATELMSIQRLVRKKSKELKHYFCGYFLEGFVRFSKKKLSTTISSDSDGFSHEDLSIVENDVLEESIAITSITQRVDTYFAEPMWALNQRFAILNSSEPVTDASNPVSPIQFCDALRRSLALVELNARAKLVAYKVFDFQLMDLFQLVSEDVNAYLQRNGVLPNIKFTLPKGAAPKSNLSEDGDSFGRRAEDRILPERALDSEAPTDQYQSDLLAAIRGLHQRVNPPASGETGRGMVPDYTSQQLVNVLTSIQSEPSISEPLFSQPQEQLVPIDITSVINQLKQKLSEDTKSEDVKKDDMQTIELVGMVFEYMLNDENIPDSVKTVLSYLHTPFLKVAFVDPGFFESSEHPARVLLNSLAEAGARWMSNDGSSQFDIFEQIKSTVGRLVKEFDNDVKVITTLLFEFKSYVKTVSRKQELTEKRAKEKAEGEDKLREMKLKVNDAVRSRIQDRELPSAVLLLMLQPWSDYLTLLLLRHGDKSSKWSDGLSVVDDVLWCIQPKSLDGEKTEQKNKLEHVSESLKQGFKVIGYDVDKGEKLIDSFKSLCDLALDEKEVEPAPEPMRSELERIAAERAGHVVLDEEFSEEEAQMVESLKMIEFGTWFEFEGGKRLKVAWYNGRTSHYMLVDQMGKRANMESGLALARKMIAGQAKIISGSSKPFFERALENIYHKLNEKADSIQPEIASASNE